MAETQETIADIISEKRRRADEIERDVAEKMKRGEMTSDQYARELVADIRREADRLEAAHKREKSAIVADALAVGGIVEAKRKRESEESKHREEVKSLQATIKKLNDALTEQNGERGNSAALREALKAAELGLFRWLSGSISRDEHRELVATIKTALAAPARNCDKVKTSWDVLKEWHEGLDTANDVVRLLDWLLAPAQEKEGGAK